MNEKLVSVGILGTNGGISLSENGLSKSMQLVGNNTGNLLFQYAINKYIVNPKVSIPLDDLSNLDFYKNNIDVCIVPAANQINPSWDLIHWYNFLEKLQKPIIVIGLGAQSKDNSSIALNLKKGTRMFLDLLKERCDVIGLRGKYTQDILSSLNVNNTEITGCPTNFINLKFSGKDVHNNIIALREKDNPRMNFLVGTLEDYVRSYESKLFELCYQNLEKIVFQTNETMLDYIYFNRVKDSKSMEWYIRTIAPNVKVGEMKWKVKHRGKFYFDSKAWIDDMRFADVSIGMRIHGSIAATQSGSVGVCVTFDSRTNELIETMGYPHISYKDLDQIENLDSVFKSIKFDPERFDLIREDLKRKSKNVLERHGVKTTL